MELYAFLIGPFFCQILEDLFLPTVGVKKKLMAGRSQDNFSYASVSARRFQCQIACGGSFLDKPRCAALVDANLTRNAVDGGGFALCERVHRVHDKHTPAILRC